VGGSLCFAGDDLYALVSRVGDMDDFGVCKTGVFVGVEVKEVSGLLGEDRSFGHPLH